LRGASGAIWKLEDTKVEPLVERAGTLSRYVPSPDGRWLAVATAQGLLRIYDLQTAALHARWQLPVAIRDLAFRGNEDQGREDQIAVAAGASVYLLGIPLTRRSSVAADVLTLPPPWITLHSSINSIEVSPDGKWFAMLGRDKTLWFQDIAQSHWTCALVSSAELLFGYFAKDSKHFLVTDADGRVLLVAMNDLTSRSP
jgi:WD40 repeat protein